MMNAHRSSRLRTLAGGAAVLVLAGLGAGLGTPGFAHPHPEGEGEGKQRRIMIVETKGGEAHGDRVREFRLNRGEDGAAELPEGCREGGSEVLNESSAEGDRRTRFIICARGDATAADRIEMLENARRRLAENEHLSAEQRTRIDARLDEEIARLRAAR